MLPKLNDKRALFVLTKIDEMLAWERRSEAERDTRIVELGDICARFGRGSTGGWRKLSPLMSFWRGGSGNPGGRLTT